MTSEPTIPPVMGADHDDRLDDAVVTRSAERLTVSTEVLPHRRAVLRVRTTTEQVMVPVTRTRQYAEVEYVDLDSATAIAVGSDRLLGGAPSARSAGRWSATPTSRWSPLGRSRWDALPNRVCGRSTSTQR